MAPTLRQSRLLRFGDAAAGLLHAVLLGTAVVWHEPWFDEAQAWLIARDATTAELVTHYARYEGSPVLWHLLLSVPAKLGLPYGALAILAAAASIVAGALVLFRSPFPRPVKLLIPFSYWLVFQYGAVARSYALLAPLLFTIAFVWPSRLRRPWVLLGLLVLLANVSVHGFLVAGGILAVHCVGVVRQYRTLDQASRFAHASVLFAFAALSGALVLQLRTPDDVTFHGAEPRDLRDVAAAGRYASAMARGALANASPISVIAFVVSAAWFVLARCFLLWFLPTAAVIALSTFQYGAVWHQGIVMLVWLFAFWVSLQRAIVGARSMWLRRMALAGLAGVLLVQINWTVRSVHYDVSHSYSGASETASFLQDGDLTRDGVAATGFSTMAIQPYFDDNIFANYLPGDDVAFWFWSTRMVVLPPGGSDPRGAVATVVVEDKAAGESVTKPPPFLPGYRLVRHVRGSLYFKSRILESEGFYVFRRVDELPG